MSLRERIVPSMSTMANLTPRRRWVQFTAIRRRVVRGRQWFSLWSGAEVVMGCEGGVSSGAPADHPTTTSRSKVRRLRRVRDLSEPHHGRSNRMPSRAPTLLPVQHGRLRSPTRTLGPSTLMGQPTHHHAVSYRERESLRSGEMIESAPARTGPVVVGHDGSRHAETALRSGLTYARAFGAPLMVVRAWQLDPDAPAYTRIMAGESSFPEITASVRAALKDACALTVSEEPEVETEYRAALGRPADILTEMSATARVLVVGSRGLGGLRGLLLGSVSDRCAHQAVCPVLIVHPESVATPSEAAQKGPTDRRAPDVAPGSIIVGHDGSPNSRLALDIAFDYATALHAPLTVIRCWTIDEMPQGLLWRDGYVASFEEASEAVRGQLNQDVSESAARHPGVKVSCHGVLGDPAETLVHLSVDAAVLVIGSRGHGGFSSLLIGSVSAYCLHRAVCDTVVVPFHREPRQNSATAAPW